MYFSFSHSVLVARPVAPVARSRTNIEWGGGGGGGQIGTKIQGSSTVEPITLLDICPCCTQLSVPATFDQGFRSSHPRRIPPGADVWWAGNWGKQKPSLPFLHTPSPSVVVFHLPQFSRRILHCVGRTPLFSSPLPTQKEMKVPNCLNDLSLNLHVDNDRS